MPSRKTIFRFSILTLCETLILTLLPLVWILRKLFYPLASKRRISIWCGAPILTVAKNSRAERLLGFNSISVVQSSYYITKEFDIDLTRLAKGNAFIAFLLTYVALLLVSIAAAQVHAYVDGGILYSRNSRRFNLIELLFYRILGIHLLVWTYGGDVRTRKVTLGLGEPNCCTDCTQVNIACICDSKKGDNNYNQVLNTAKAIFSMGDMIEYTPRSRNNLFFWPIDLMASGGKRYQPAYPKTSIQEALRVVHAPNHREFKGTCYLESAVESLLQEEVNIELILVEGVSNEEALDIYRSADLIFDQCIIGFHGYFALEAMALGKPVMCYIRKPLEYLLHPSECPIINTHITTLKDDLRFLVAQRHDLNEIGRRGRNYVEKYYSLEAFAERLGKTYQELGVFA